LNVVSAYVYIQSSLQLDTSNAVVVITSSLNLYRLLDSSEMTPDQPKWHGTRLDPDAVTPSDQVTRLAELSLGLIIWLYTCR